MKYYVLHNSCGDNKPILISEEENLIKEAKEKLDSYDKNKIFPIEVSVIDIDDLNNIINNEINKRIDMNNYYNFRMENKICFKEN